MLVREKTIQPQAAMVVVELEAVDKRRWSVVVVNPVADCITVRLTQGKLVHQ